MTNASDHKLDVPKISVEEMQNMVNQELSLPSRLGYTVLLLAALTVAGGTASLWLTEVGLPARTRIAFAAIVIIGSAWVVYALWVLTRRRVLLAGHRIIAGRMAVAFSAVFAAGSLALGVYAATAFGLLMVAVAIGVLVHARRRFAQLTYRRRELEEMLRR